MVMWRYTILLGTATSADPDFNGIDPADVSATNTDNDSVIPPTKFYVVDDATANKTFEYSAAGASIESYSLGNTTPRGRRARCAGDTIWVVDANRYVYVYDTSGVLQGSWLAGYAEFEVRCGRHCHRRHRCVDRRFEERQGLQVRGRCGATYGQSDFRQQFQPERQQHQSEGHCDRRRVDLGRQR